MYFDKFPYTVYSLDDRESVQLIKDIFRRITLDESIKNNYSLFDEYDACGIPTNIYDDQQ